MKNKNNFNLLDCTLRDGGYYNNWNFSLKLIQNYLNEISKTDIKYVELGFRGFFKNKQLGPTGYTDDNLIKKLKFPNLLKIGVMINASDLYKNNFSPLKNLKRLFPKINIKIFFVRFACHTEEVFGLKDSINWLSKKGISVFINIMQVSELDLHDLKKICVYLKKENIKALYFADSLGALEIKKFKKINKFLKKHWNKDLGLHAHDNLNLALKNSEYAIKNNFRWIDSTIMGMGRGPGNLKTEEIIKKFNKNQVLIINKLKNRYFNKLKQKYKWGTNKYYREAAKKKIHPTYIQNMLADIKYRERDYETILKSLANEDAKKFNPHKLFLSSNIYNKQKKGK
jgi:4-hydroxy 2-oxovalerate aldolase